MVKCQVCGYDNPDESQVCLNCGSPIEKKRVTEAIDDISGEATILIGGPPKGFPKPAPPAAAPVPPPPAYSAPPPPPARPAAPPPPAPAYSSAPPPPPPQQPAYGQPPAAPSQFGSAPPSSSLNPLALASVITGGMSIILCCLYMGLPLGIAALVTGFLGKKQLGDDKGTNNTLIIVGMVLGGIGALLGLVHIVLVIIGFTAQSMGNM